MNIISKSIVLATLLSGLSCYAMESVAPSGRKVKNTVKMAIEKYRKDCDSLSKKLSPEEFDFAEQIAIEGHKKDGGFSPTGSLKHKYASCFGNNVVVH